MLRTTLHFTLLWFLSTLATWLVYYFGSPRPLDHTEVIGMMVFNAAFIAVFMLLMWFVKLFLDHRAFKASNRSEPSVQTHQ